MWKKPERERELVSEGERRLLAVATVCKVLLNSVSPFDKQTLYSNFKAIWNSPPPSPHTHTQPTINSKIWENFFCWSALSWFFGKNIHISVNLVRIIKPPKLWENFRSFTLFLSLSLFLLSHTHTHAHTRVSTTDKCLRTIRSVWLGFCARASEELTNYRRSQKKKQVESFKRTRRFP